MDVTFYGAVREVTGSMHLLTNGTDRILLDCGMFQGRRKESEEKNRTFPFAPHIITNLVLSHAHIDHSGRIPLLTRQNFNGRVICTRATANACEYLLMDAGHIQESDAKYLNYKALRSLLYQMSVSPRTRKLSKTKEKRIKQFLKKGKHELNTENINELMDKYRLEQVRPIYTVADAEKALGYFDGYPYRHEVVIGKNTSCVFYDAGHILGSAITMIQARENGRVYTICYTGDLGRFNKPILKDPQLKFAESEMDVDLLVMESTYGDRFHDPVEDAAGNFKEVLIRTIERGGVLVIPAFAFGRTQELIYMLHKLYLEGDVPKVPVYVDSPLATKLTRIFGEHPEVYDRETHETFLEKGLNPFDFKQMHFVESLEESMALNRDERPHVVISASGMCEAGRILHHLRYRCHNEKNTILIVGYMAQNTLGRRIQELGQAYALSGRKGDPPTIKILNKEYPLKAQVVTLDAFSAHADRAEMLKFLKASNLRIKKIAAVHGEEEQIEAFGKFLEKEGFNVIIPRTGESVRIH